MSRSMFMARTLYRQREANGKGIEQWPRMRLTKCDFIIRPAFLRSQRSLQANNAYVWAETCRTMNQWFSTFQSKSELPVECLSVFKQAGFSPLPFSWVADNGQDRVSRYRFCRVWRKDGLQRLP